MSDEGTEVPAAVSYTRPASTIPSVFSLKPIEPGEIPKDSVLLRDARVMLEGSLSWQAGKACDGVRTFFQDDWLWTGNHGHTRTWHCVVSSLPQDEDLSFTRLWSKIGQNKTRNLKSYLPNITKVARVRYISEEQSIWTMLYAYPPPLSRRVYTVFQASWLLEYPHRRRGIIVTLPVDLTTCENLSEIEERGIRGHYVSVEHLQEMDDDTIEWRRICYVDPGGLIPKFWSKKRMPGRLILETHMCMKWLRSQKNAKAEDAQGRTGELTLEEGTIMNRRT